MPPKDFYATEAEMFNDIQAWLAQHAYAFQKGRSRQISKNCIKVVYKCDCAGKLLALNCQRDELQRPYDRICNTSSKKTGYEFSVNSVQVNQHH
jgi:hypothetical protein